MEKQSTILEKNPELVYLEWFNDFLTTAGMAKYYGVKEKKLIDIIEEGERLHYKKHSI